METSIKKMKDFGIAFTSVRNTNNISFLGYYSELASSQGMIGITANNAALSIALWGEQKSLNRYQSVFCIYSR